MPSSSGARIIEQFDQHLSASDDPERVGRAAAQLWTLIGVRLGPILGNNGLKAMYARSVFVTGRRFPRLRAVPDDASFSDSLAELTRSLNGLTRDEAHTIALALFREFHELMTIMVGQVLTTELLGSSWELPVRDTPAPATE